MARAKDTEVTGESASEAEEAGTEEESFALRGKDVGLSSE